MAVRAVRPKDQRNEEGAVDNSKQKDTIEITAYFDGAETAEAYFGLSSYLQYTRKELAKCCEIVEKAQKREGAIGYEFPWREVDESQIEVNGFEKKKLQFTIAQDNILQLLVGHTLYNDSSVVVRELVQNGIDAVRLQTEYEKRNGKDYSQGKVWVEWNSAKRQLSFWDNGTGMSIQDVENYLLKVGASKYRDEVVKKQFPNFTSISHFGIGILTCFMVANDIDIVTSSDEQEEANSINLRKVNGSYLLRKMDKNELDVRIKQHGTMVKLYVRSDVDMTKLENDLRKWIVVPEIPVYLSVDGNENIRIGYDSLKEILIKYLNETGHDVDGKKYDVYETKHGNVTVAYAVRHLKYMSDWCLMSADNRRVQRKTILPIGTCVEGIRVEFSTPGYKNTSILAIANIKNSKYQTNVARSAIELDANNEILSDIYDVYKDYVQEQMDRLEDQDYAQSWAVSEGRYLMRPLIYDDYSNSRIEPIDEDVLIRRLAHLKCLALENEGVRQMVSAEDVAELEEINIFECEMTRAGEYLLKEVRSSATLSSLIGVVCKDNFLAGVKNVICNIDMGNLLHQYALKNKEVSKIEVAHKERRIHVTYSCKNDLWYEFDLRNRGLAARSLYIPKKNMVISGLKEEIGVKNFGGIYIQSNTELCEYLIKVIGAFQSEDTEENKILLEVFLSYVFDNKVLEVAYKQDVNTSNMFKQLLEERFVRVSNELIEKMWAKIDTQEFVNKILTKNYTLYSIDNWSRKNDSIVKEWQERPLQEIYVVVYMDAIHYHVRSEGRIVKRAVYIALRIDMDGKKDVIGMYVGENEGAKFWLSIINGLKNRGVQDILIACVDGLNGFPQAIEAVYPKTEIQQCIIHQIRNTTNYISYKDLKKLMADLKMVYAAPDEAAALEELESFGEKWNNKYPKIYKSWSERWATLSTYFKYPNEVRKLIYTTNAIEGFNRQLRKVTKSKTVFPSDDSLLKMLYLATMDITKKWTGRRRDWSQIRAQLEIYFEERLEKAEF